MNIEIIKNLAYELMKDRKAQPDREKGYIYYHGERVSKLAIGLRKRLFPDDCSHDEHIIAASLFHDIGKGFNPHEKYGAIVIKDILRDFCSESDIEIIAELIGLHQGPRQDPNVSGYARIIQDADILDRMGTMQIWLNFCNSASKDLTVRHALDFYNNEFRNYAKDLRDILNYSFSEEIFDEKVSYMLAFIERLNIEAEGGVMYG